MTEVPTVMPLETAWKLVADAVQSYRGTLAEHQTLQMAMNVVAGKLRPATPNEPEVAEGG